MRFPRTNLTDAGDFSSSETDVEHAGEEAYVPPAAPVWQNNFALAPNVRFTRTPENLISKRRTPEEPVSKRRSPSESVQPAREEIVEQQAIHA